MTKPSLIPRSRFGSSKWENCYISATLTCAGVAIILNSTIGNILNTFCIAPCIILLNSGKGETETWLLRRSQLLILFVAIPEAQYEIMKKKNIVDKSSCDSLVSNINKITIFLRNAWRKWKVMLYNVHLTTVKGTRFNVRRRGQGFSFDFLPHESLFLLQE